MQNAVVALQKAEMGTPTVGHPASMPVDDMSHANESAASMTCRIEQALVRLGAVTIISFADGGFMIVRQTGQRFRGASLMEVIETALGASDCRSPQLGYRGDST